MIRTLIAMLSGAAALVLCTAVIGQSSEDAKRPLDLPAGKIGRDEEDEEDETESIIFYGAEFEADAFFWCLDRSGSMAGAKLATLKQEVTSAITTLTNRAELGLVAFENGQMSWQTIPVKATVSNKASATAWVQALTTGGATCMAPAAVTTINICNQSRLRHKAVIIVSDGVPNCPGCGETVTAVTAANWQRNPVNTLFIGSEASGSTCMQQIASANGGSFTQVQ
ncbi:MAG: VWA domain-containing protein [Planctomycetota bacterium]